MHADMQRATEQVNSMEMKNAVNSQRIIWFTQGIYYERLSSAVLSLAACIEYSTKKWSLCFTNFSRHSAIWSSFYVCSKKCSQATRQLRQGHLYTFFIMPTRLTKFESCNPWLNREKANALVIFTFPIFIFIYLIFDYEYHYNF